MRTKLYFAAKSAAESLSYPIGRLLSGVPFAWRLGSEYARVAAQIGEVGSMHAAARSRWVAGELRRVLAGWQALVGAASLRRLEIRGEEPGTVFEAVRRLPVTTKGELSELPPRGWLSGEPGSFPANTGGTSGEPLEFALSKACFAREWAHMHAIWRLLGYRQTDLKWTLRGKDLGSSAFVYNAVHHEFLINPYLPLQQLCPELLELARERGPRYLHGYPSVLADFAARIGAEHRELLGRIRSNLRGVLLGSEFPAPHYRKIIEEVFGVPTISWYGHSEMAVLAHEKPGEPFRYHVMPTYGFAEAVADGGEGARLVATSFVNTASMFVRYDTGDRIDGLEYEDGRLSSFRVDSGRVGDFVLDASGHRIGLTALIFGRHHGSFAFARHIQVSQPAPGRIVVWVVPRDSGVSENELAEGFNFQNVNLEVEVHARPEPYRTRLGKAPLLIPSEAAE